MRIDGVWKMKREGRRFAKRGEITVRIGSAVDFPPGTPPEEIASQLSLHHRRPLTPQFSLMNVHLAG